MNGYEKGLTAYRLRRFVKGLTLKTRRLNNMPRMRLDWEQMERQGGTAVIKGTARRVIVVKSPDPRIFEEAIFVMRDDFAAGKGADSEYVIKEAQRVADSYIRSTLGKGKMRRCKLPAPAFAAAGAAATGIAWLAMHLAGV